MQPVLYIAEFNRDCIIRINNEVRLDPKVKNPV